MKERIENFLWNGFVVAVDKLPMDTTREQRIANEKMIKQKDRNNKIADRLIREDFVYLLYHRERVSDFLFFVAGQFGWRRWGAEQSGDFYAGLPEKYKCLFEDRDYLIGAIATVRRYMSATLLDFEALVEAEKNPNVLKQIQSDKLAVFDRAAQLNIFSGEEQLSAKDWQKYSELRKKYDVEAQSDSESVRWKQRFLETNHFESFPEELQFSFEQFIAQRQIILSALRHMSTRGYKLHFGGSADSMQERIAKHVWFCRERLNQLRKGELELTSLEEKGLVETALKHLKRKKLIRELQKQAHELYRFYNSPANAHLILEDPKGVEKSIRTAENIFAEILVAESSLAGMCDVVATIHPHHK